MNQVFYLTDKFDLIDKDKKNSTGINISSIFKESSIYLNAQILKPKKKSVDNFSNFNIFVTPTIGAILPIQLNSATLQGNELDLVLFTALWKGLEKQIKNIFGLDDLVQLSGYYQYISKLQAKLELRNGEKKIPPIWNVLDKIMRGIGVAKQLPITSFSELWKISVEEALYTLHKLRAIGYEVRNSNTNSQIKKDEFLVPYIFPTLTSRSIQSRKSL